MKTNPLNRMIVAVGWGTALFLFAGMSISATAQYSTAKKKKIEQPAPYRVKQGETQQRRYHLKQEQTQHDQRLSEYRLHLEQQQRLHEQNMARLQREKRMSHYRYQQQYSLHMLQQRRRYDNGHTHYYSNDPFFQAGFDRRYNRGGTYYQTNRYGVDHIHQSIRYGYSEGFLAGMADRDDHWRYDVENCDAYRDANYGYNGYYVSQDDYNHYFREGFRRGYEDGYNNRYRYGRFSNGQHTILASVLAGIITFEMLRR